MHQLSEQELYQALAYAKSINEESGAKIIEQFQSEQTGLAQAIFSIFPQAIAQENEDMSYLFMDLCFDVLCVFQKAFGPLPSQERMDYDWLERQAALIDTELQALIQDKFIDEKTNPKPQDAFVNPVAKDSSQNGLVDFMNNVIDDFAAEDPSRLPAIKTTRTMIFIVIRLFGNLYSAVNKTA